MKNSPVNTCVRAATYSGAGCALHKGTLLGRWGAWVLNITDNKDLHIYYVSIPVDGSVLSKGAFKTFQWPTNQL